MRYLTLKETLELHHRILEQSRGIAGVRDLGTLESALAQPLMTFGGEELYPTIIEKASALGFPLLKTILLLMVINESAMPLWRLSSF